jgi:hypothetical protein
MKKFIYVALLAFGVALMVAPPAMAQEDKAATIHGEVRFRGEYNNNASDFFDDTDDGALYWPYRVRISAEKSFTKNVSAYIEFQNAGVAGNSIFGPTKAGFVTTSGEGVELYQGNMTLDQLWSKNFSLRIGRQEIVAGNELLLGDLDFYAGLSHDGGVGTWKLRKVNVMVWYTRPAEGSVSTITGPFLPPDQQIIGSPTSTIHFLGGYASWAWKKDQSFDVYLMALNDRGTTASFQTIGARWAHDVTNKDGLFWSAELAQQFGDAATGIDASGRVIEGWVGYNWRKGKNTHRIYGRLGLATGDDTSSGGDFEGFMPLFGDFHNRTGRGDWFQLQDTTTFLGLGATGGLQAFGLGWNAFNGDRHEFGAQYWSYTLQEDNGGDDDLGSALDVWYGFNYSRNVGFVASLSQLQPGDALTGGGADDSVTRLYGQARLRF